MDTSAYNSCEQSSLISELTQGMNLAKQLKAQMGPEYSVETKEMLLKQIVSSYDKALFILGCGGARAPPHQLVPVPSPVMPSSPASTMESPKSDDLHVRFNAHHDDGKETSKKRKAASTWTKEVKLNSETGLDAPPADGYSWRKYGQKDILGAKHPRSYYRCTYRNIQDCWATKQVQRLDADPTVLHVTYKGNHTCTMSRRSKSAPTSPGEQEPKTEGLSTMEHHQDSAMVLSYENAPDTIPQNMNCYPFSLAALSYLNGQNPGFLPSTSNTNNFYGRFSPSLISPSTSGSNYFSISPCKMDNFASVEHQQYSLEADVAEILSATTSATNSPIIEPDFSLDPWSFNSNLPFNNL